VPPVANPDIRGWISVEFAESSTERGESKGVLSFRLQGLRSEPQACVILAIVAGARISAFFLRQRRVGHCRFHSRVPQSGKLFPMDYLCPHCGQEASKSRACVGGVSDFSLTVSTSEGNPVTQPTNQNAATIDCKSGTWRVSVRGSTRLTS
jgi:hypothetical protein